MDAFETRMLVVFSLFILPCFLVGDVLSCGLSPACALVDRAGSARVMARRMAGTGGAFSPPAGRSTTLAIDNNNNGHSGQRYHSSAFGAAFRTPVPPMRMAVSASAASTSTKKAPTPAKKKKAATTAASRKPSPVKKTAAAVKKTSAAAATATKKGSSTNAGDKKVLVIVESPAKARTITALLEKAGAGDGGKLYKGYTVDACNGHVTDLVSKRKDVPAELKEQTKGWDVVGVDVVRVGGV